MNSSNIVWIAIAAVVAVFIIIGLVVLARNASRRRREREAEGIREQARVETAKVERREALAAETAAKARAAQAEAEAKAAEAARLQDRASAHHSEVASSREQLNEQLQRADSLDPRVKTQKDSAADEGDIDRDAAWSQEQPIPDNSPTVNLSGTERDAGSHRAGPT
jgi:flagellar biosynthesis/type III secretory pathway M-ring protein FliF/YscJ